MEGWWYKFTKTVFLVLIWVSMGLYMEIYGPSLIDLKLLYDTDYSSVSAAIGFRGVGGFLGSLVGGILVDKCPNWHDLIVALATALSGLATGAVPFIHSTHALLFLCVACGVGVGATNIAGQRLIITLWKQKAAGPTHIIHMGFGIGAFIIPVLTNPFLADIQTGTANQLAAHMSLTNQSGVFNLTNETTTAMPQSANQSEHSIENGISSAWQDLNLSKSNEPTGYVVLTETKVQYAFLLVSVIALLTCIPFLVFQCIEYRDIHSSYKPLAKCSPSDCSKSRTFKEMINPSTYTDGAFCYGTWMFLLLFLYYFNVAGGEQMFGTFVRSFSIDMLQFSKDNASYLNMWFWMWFTGGRLVGSLLSHMIHIKHLIVIEVLLNFASVTILDILGANNATMLWVLTALQGLISGPLFPAAISYANTVIDVSGVVLMVICFGASSGDLVYLWLSGKVYDMLGPRSILHAVQVSGILVLVSVIILRVVSHGRKERYTEVIGDLADELQHFPDRTMEEEETAGLLVTSSEDEL